VDPKLIPPLIAGAVAIGAEGFENPKDGRTSPPLLSADDPKVKPVVDDDPGATAAVDVVDGATASAFTPKVKGVADALIELSGSFPQPSVLALLASGEAAGGGGGFEDPASFEAPPELSGDSQETHLTAFFSFCTRHTWHLTLSVAIFQMFLLGSAAVAAVEVALAVDAAIGAAVVVEDAAALEDIVVATAAAGDAFDFVPGAVKTYLMSLISIEDV
jgi:hypothetical protein